jgi:hypothetical protein
MPRCAARRSAAGRERARSWKRQWYRKRRRLDAAMVMDEICASYAAAQVGIPHRRIRRDLEAAAARYSPRQLLGFDHAPAPSLAMFPTIASAVPTTNPADAAVENAGVS